MAYTDQNFKSKADIRRALEAGEVITVNQPSPWGAFPVGDGPVSLEGPHYPEPHRWYGTGEVRNGRLVSIK